MSNIEKWFYFSLNYEMKYYEWTDIFGKGRAAYLPKFLMEINWNCGRDHLIDKWFKIADKSDSYGTINRFYAELGDKNRELLEEYVLNNGE